MRRLLASALTTTLACAGLSACATGPFAHHDAPPAPVAASAAPAPAKPVDVGRLYVGTWHEIARNPMGITDGCVAGVTSFYRDGKGRLIDRDSCRKGDADLGQEKVFKGPVRIENPPDSTEFTTKYDVFGLLLTRTYRILDHDDQYTWFIVATPDFKNLSIFTRSAHPGRALTGQLVERVKGLGYDPARLEFPQQPIV